MSDQFRRRAVLAGGLGLAGAVLGAKARQVDQIRAGLERSRILAAPQEPLFVAMLDTHAARLAPLVPEIEETLGRRISIEALEAEELYANFTFDLMQQTGRYDAVSMNDAWIPYFGRRGYLTGVPDVEQTGTSPTYPQVIHDSARGVDGTELVAYPWTFDYSCSAVSRTLDLHGWSTNWTDLFSNLGGYPDARFGLALRSPTAAAETFRAILLSYGGDLVDPESHQPRLDSYAARRALETTVRLAKLDDSGKALQRTLDRVPRLAANGEIDVAPVFWASDSMSLWESDAWDIELLPAGRVGHAATTGTFWMWGVPAGAPSIDKARAFVQLMTSFEIQSRLWSATGLLPATQLAMNSQWDPGGWPLRLLTLRALGRCRFRPQLRSFRSLMQIAGEMVSEAVSAGGDPADYRRNANEEMYGVLIQEGELNS